MIHAPIQRVDYDRPNDILYVAFSDQSNSYGDEVSDNIVIRRDWDDDHITGVTIFNFMKLISTHSSEFLQIPFDIDFKKQILPFCSTNLE